MCPVHVPRTHFPPLPPPTSASPLRTYVAADTCSQASKIAVASIIIFINAALLVLFAMCMLHFSFLPKLRDWAARRNRSDTWGLRSIGAAGSFSQRACRSLRELGGRTWRSCVSGPGTPGDRGGCVDTLPGSRKRRKQLAQFSFPHLYKVCQS